MKIKVSQLIADFWVEKEIEHVFTVTGGGAMHLNDSFGHHKDLKCVYNHHEQGSAIAAEGYFRASGKIAGVCVTTGPGGTNAITGVMGSWVDSIPVFVVSGQIKFETSIASVPHLNLRQLGDQEFNIIDCVKCMTKYAEMVIEPADILYHLQKAYYLMKEGRPGPVWLDIPLDIQATFVNKSELRQFDPRELPKVELKEFTDSDAEDLLAEITKAKKPVIFAGTAIQNVGYVDKFVEFCERVNVPVVTAWNAHDTIWDSHHLSCGRPGSMGTRAGNFIVQNSDLLIVIGSQLNIRQISYNWKSFAKNAKLIVVDIDKNELDKPTLNIYRKYNCDLKNVIDVCLSNKKFKLDNHRKWLAWAKDIYDRYSKEKFLASKENLMNPYEFYYNFSSKINKDDIIVCSNGSACVITFQAFEVKQGQRMFANSGCATMGYGVPAAVGAAFANKENRIICLDGDGSIQMNLQELAVISYHQLNIKIVVINNSGYHSIRQTQANLFKNNPLCGVSCDNGLMFPDLSLISNAYKLDYHCIKNLEEIDEVLLKLNNDAPCIIEVFVDPNINFTPKLSAKVLPDGTIVSPDIDDMSPLLPREEYESIKFKIN